MAVSGDITFPAPPFARTCQATHLLSRVVAHLNSGLGTSDDAKDYYSRSLQLHQVLSSFHTALNQDLKTEEPFVFMALSSAMGICFSAIIALCDAHTCANLDDPSGVGIPEQLKMQEVALGGLHDIGASVCEFASRLQVMSLSSHGSKAMLSPFVAEGLFAAAKQYLWYIRETGNLELLVLVEMLTGALRLLGQRWQVASKSLRGRTIPDTVVRLVSNEPIIQMNISQFSREMNSSRQVDIRIATTIETAPLSGRPTLAAPYYPAPVPSSPITSLIIPCF